MKKLIALIASISLLGSTLICRGKEIEVNDIYYVSLEFDNKYNIDIRCYYAEKDGVNWFYKKTKKITIENNIFTHDGEPYYFLKQDDKIAYAISLKDGNFIDIIDKESTIRSNDKRAYIAENDLENLKEIKWKGIDKKPTINIHSKLKELIMKENVEKAKAELKKFDEKGKVYEIDFFTRNPYQDTKMQPSDIAKDKQYLRILGGEEKIKDAIEKAFKVTIHHICMPDTTNPQILVVLINSFNDSKDARDAEGEELTEGDYVNCIKDKDEAKPIIIKYLDCVFDKDHNINLNAYYDKKNEIIKWYEKKGLPSDLMTLSKSNSKRKSQDMYYDTINYYYLGSGLNGLTYAIQVLNTNFEEKVSKKTETEEKKVTFCEKDLPKLSTSMTIAESTVTVDEKIVTWCKDITTPLKEYLKKLDERDGKVYRPIFFTEDRHAQQFFEYLRVTDEKNLRQEIETKYKVAVLHIQKPETNPQFPNILIKTFDNTNVKKSDKNVDPNNTIYKTCIKEYGEKQRAITENVDRILIEFAGALSATLKS